MIQYLFLLFVIILIIRYVYVRKMREVEDSLLGNKTIEYFENKNMLPYINVQYLDKEQQISPLPFP